MLYFAAMQLGDWDVRVDPWAVDYGAETPGASALPPEAAVDVDVAVETVGSRWVPVVPAPRRMSGPVIFIDGVRRIEGRLVMTSADRVIHGAIGTAAVGSVHTGEHRATFGESRIDRVLIFGNGVLPASALALGPRLQYRPVSVADDDADAPIRGLHAEMRVAEQALAASLAVPGALVIADGPLSITARSASPVVGFVKRLFQLYVPAEQLAVVRRLPAGARSPVFLIRSTGRFGRYSWFVRLATPLRVESEFTGIVRLEVAEAGGLEQAVSLANAITGWLPRLVPSRTRDPRAPQNLVPIGALEQHLRHQMGDSRLIHRRLATRLARESAHV
ncbi:MAG: hypothetical protein AB7F99_11905 [Vicinamibacterales bacterium]